MHRKHFQALADAISTIQDVKERRRIARLIADVCSSQNDRFNYSTFYDACDVGLTDIKREINSRKKGRK